MSLCWSGGGAGNRGEVLTWGRCGGQLPGYAAARRDGCHQLWGHRQSQRTCHTATAGKYWINSLMIYCSKGCNWMRCIMQYYIKTSYESVQVIACCLMSLAHWGWDKMANISQTSFSNAFLERKYMSFVWLKFIIKGRINNIPALVQIMAWCRPGD